MKGEEIIVKLLDYLDQHLRGSRGSVYQEPYKRDIFALFRQAYRSGLLERRDNEHLLTADALGEILITRWFADDGEDDARERLLGEVMPMWQEWTYAWDRYQDIHDDTQRNLRRELTAADFFKAEIDELEAINEMIRKFVDSPTQDGKDHVKAYLLRWLKHDDRRPI